jgi:hypothetical protein
MCDKCDEIDRKIAHFQSFLHAGLDPLTTERIGKLISEWESQKQELHDA